jgi:Fe-S cluster assembly ATP-binding protein
MLILEDLSISVNEKKIIENFSFRFEKNKIYAVMGPNGSGKSTLAYGLMGHPSYSVFAKCLYFNGKNILDLSADKRAKLGFFLSFQSPLMLNGVNVFQLLRTVLSGEKDPLKLKKEIEATAKKLHLKNELIYRSLNDGASGGERKKLELLQAMILRPKVLILDEIDTGVDVDALKIISSSLKEFKKDRIVIVITHYQRILKHLNPDRVLVLVNGRLIKTGGANLATEIDQKGYQFILNKNSYEQ